MTGWQPIISAPKDGTAVQARIPGNGDDNVICWQDGLLDSGGNDCGGWCFASDQEPPDCWTDGWCWEVNEDGVPSVQPTHWKPRAMTGWQPNNSVNPRGSTRHGRATELWGRYVRQQDALSDAPIGTRAPSVIGGHWEKTSPGGWTWLGGSTFPRPGGDWTGALIAPPHQPAQAEDE